ncbi:unnamed protein product, partial [Amoebophrya sp. A120]
GCSAGTKKAVGSSLIQTATGTSSKAAPPRTTSSDRTERILQNITKEAELYAEINHPRTTEELSQLGRSA